MAYLFHFRPFHVLLAPALQHRAFHTVRVNRAHTRRSLWGNLLLDRALPAEALERVEPSVTKDAIPLDLVGVIQQATTTG